MKREFEIKKVNSILNNLIENSSLKEGLNNAKIQTIWKKQWEIILIAIHLK